MLKHAGRAPAEVSCATAGDALELEVVDDGRGSARDGADGGRARPGRHARAGRAATAATLEAGRAPGGGFARPGAAAASRRSLT